MTKQSPIIFSWYWEASSVVGDPHDMVWDHLLSNTPYHVNWGTPMAEIRLSSPWMGGLYPQVSNIKKNFN